MLGAEDQEDAQEGGGQVRGLERLLPAIPRPLQPVLTGLLAIPAFAVAHSVLMHSGPHDHLPWGRFLVPWVLLGVLNSKVSQRVLGRGRLDNRVMLRLLLADVLFFMVLAPTGLIFLFPVGTALAAAVYVPWAGSHTWVRAAGLSMVLHIVVQKEISMGLLPLIMTTEASHLALFASMGLALLTIAHTGMLARQKETSDAALAAEQERRHRDLVWASTHDPLSGLLNRAGLQPAMEAACASASPGTGMGLVFMDLDGFKEVNDCSGHAAGDELLRAVAERLGAQMRSGDLLARIGGDEFVALLTALPDQAPLRAFVERARSLISDPFQLSHGQAHISVSVGWSFADRPGHAVDVLLRAADSRMYEQKRARQQPSRMDTARAGS